MLACRPNMVLIGPQLAAPKCTPQTRKLRIQLSRSNAFHHVHHPCRSVARGTADKQVHVVFLNREPRPDDGSEESRQSDRPTSILYERRDVPS